MRRSIYVNPNRDITVDAIKGILIILVVIGHLVKNTSVAFDIIYSFHMPFFMFLSGYVVDYNKINIIWIKKKCKRLLLPELGIIFVGFLNSGIRFIISLPKSGFHIFWFPLALFINCVVIFFCVIIVKRMGGKYSRTIRVGAIVFLYGFRFVLNNVGINVDSEIGSFNWWFLFFSLGMFAREIQLTKLIKKQIIYIPTVILWLFLGFPWWREADIKMIEVSNEIIVGVGYKGMEIIIPLLYIFVGMFVFDKMSNNNCLKRILAIVGNYTMEIYILHFLFFIIPGENCGEFGYVIGNTLLAVVGSILVGRLFNDVTIGQILFGSTVNLKTHISGDNQ